MAADLSQASATRKKGSVRKEAAFFWSAAAKSYAAQRAGSTGKRSRRHGARFDRVHRQRDRAERAGQRPEMRRRHIGAVPRDIHRSEEHTSELQSLMRISYAVFCLKTKNKNTTRMY